MVEMTKIATTAKTSSTSFLIAGSLYSYLLIGGLKFLCLVLRLTADKPIPTTTRATITISKTFLTVCETTKTYMVGSDFALPSIVKDPLTLNKPRLGVCGHAITILRIALGKISF